MKELTTASWKCKAKKVHLRIVRSNRASANDVYMERAAFDLI